MKAIVAVRAGGPEVLEQVDVPMPSPGRGEVLVRVAASGVNFMDVGMRMGGRAGITFPRIRAARHRVRLGPSVKA